MRTITIFGGSGFIGRHLVKRLAAQGWRVRVAVRSPASANFLKLMGSVGQIQPLHADIRDPNAVAMAVAGVDAAVNLVGILSESKDRRFHEIHVTGAAEIAAAARKAKLTRLVHLSAIGADAASPALYGQSKALGEAAVQAAFPTATVMRPSLVVGPQDQFFNRFGRMARFAPALPLIGGETRFQPVAVGDVADAIVAALTRCDAQAKLYELGGPKIYRMRELFELILQVVGRKRFLAPIPSPVALFLASLLEKGPMPLLTRDQIRMLERDSIVAPDARGLIELGVDPSAIEPLLPGFMGFLRPRELGNAQLSGGHALQRNRAR